MAERRNPSDAGIRLDYGVPGKPTWVLTHDSDFGSLAIHEDKPYWGVVFLRPRDLKPDNVVRVCNRLLQQDGCLSTHHGRRNPHSSDRISAVGVANPLFPWSCR